MRLDDMTDEQLDAGISQLVTRVTLDREWKAAQRQRLMHTITASGAATSPSTSETSSELVKLGVDNADTSRRHVWSFATAAAVAAIVVVGLAMIQREPQADSPAQRPPVSPATSSPASTIDRAPSTVIDPPDRFAVVTDDWPSASTALASWDGMVGSNGAEALVARRDGDFLRDAVALTVRADPIDASVLGPPQLETVGDTTFEVYTEPGSPPIVSVVLPGTPTLIASGLDPLKFVRAAAGIPVEDAQLDDANGISFDIGSLPDGYEVVVAPTFVPPGSVTAITRASDGDAGDGIVAQVGVRNPMISYGQGGDLQRVDINGETGWLRDRGLGSTVMFAASDHTWVLVAGAINASDALTFARSLEFVDEATWTQRYDVKQPNFPTPEQMADMASATVATSAP